MLVLTNRTRSRSTWHRPLSVGSEGGERWGNYSIGGVDQYGRYYGGTFASFRTWEEISDVVGKKRADDGSYGPSNVISTKIKVQTKSVPSWIPNPSSNPQDLYTVDRLDVEVWPGRVTSLVPDVPDGLWYDFAEQAFNSFATQIPEDIGLANFVWELRELGSLLPRLSKSVSQTTSGGILNMEFGWKPFLSDLDSLFNIVSNVRSKIEHLKATFGKTTRLGEFQGNVFEPNMSSYTLLAPHSNVASEVSLLFELKGYRADLRAGAYLYHRLQDLNELSSFIRAMIVALGLSNPLKAVWNALPYSFVIDWFTGLSGRLGVLSVNPFKGPWIVSRQTTSMKITASIDVTSKFASPGMGSDALLGNILYQRYVRLAQLPVRSSFLANLITPTPKQQMLLLALLGARA